MQKQNSYSGENWNIKVSGNSFWLCDSDERIPLIEISIFNDFWRRASNFDRMLRSCQATNKYFDIGYRTIDGPKLDTLLLRNTYVRETSLHFISIQ